MDEAAAEDYSAGAKGAAPEVGEVDGVERISVCEAEAFQLGVGEFLSARARICSLPNYSACHKRLLQ